MNTDDDYSEDKILKKQEKEEEQKMEKRSNHNSMYHVVLLEMELCKRLGILHFVNGCMCPIQRRSQIFLLSF